MRLSRGPLVAMRSRKAVLLLSVAVLLTLTASMSMATTPETSYDEDFVCAQYQGVWEEVAEAGAYGGKLKHAEGDTAVLTVGFDGPSIQWIARMGPIYGKARVRVNGGEPLTVDLYSPTFLDQQVVFKRDGLEDGGTHTLQIGWLGDPLAGPNAINVDAFVVEGRLGTYPLAVDDAFTVLEDGVLAAAAPGILGVHGQPGGDDVRDGVSLDVRAYTQPAHGALSLDVLDGSFTYTPDVGYHGGDTFTYSVIDEHGHSSDATATVTITVTPVSEYYDLAGENRFETAVDAALTGWPTGAETVVIATGENFPDALGGSALAGAYDAPLLLVNRDLVRAEVADAIRKLGAKRAFVLGGKSAVSDNVIAKVKAVMGEGAQVDRIPGANRYETARRVAAGALDKLDDHDGVAFVATGASFPDALASGPISAYAGWPVYLVGADNSATIAAMKAAGITSVKVLGGEKAVPSSTYEALKRAFPGKVSRIAGSDRYDTAARVAELAPSAGMTWEGTGIASGANFPDALAAGALLGKVEAPLLLTAPKSLSAPAMARLQTHRVEISDLRFFGGPSALSAAVRTSAKRTVEAP